MFKSINLSINLGESMLNVLAWLESVKLTGCMCSLFTLVELGFQNYVKSWGGGQICPIKKFQNRVENHFCQSLP